MAGVELLTHGKLTLSYRDKDDLRRLIINEIYLYRKENWATEEIIKRATIKLTEFIESRYFEVRAERTEANMTGGIDIQRNGLAIKRTLETYREIFEALERSHPFQRQQFDEGPFKNDEERAAARKKFDDTLKDKDVER